ncbi:aldehyde dehydrogenase (NADP(+)) [Sphingomonas sp. CBMAI 2297]|uniref:aldehyde dehydrogenase (NADP(+)) n=1 Tax=Sphingomonas sp. CBMAI 2297 TaxID=2991720 RepID=UPI0024570E50|nr:aldehyde dehydrogenase (NADP(+)) [Sphingomonas sp. CBMAI 2297]MDH4745428.1 aldehyde dehydrogenase (NADP(+)) [Sphingomonas sp. CBMAI 2297]
MALTGELFIASKRVRRDGPGFRAVAASTGASLEPSFDMATREDVEAAAAAAEAAFPAYANLPREQRAAFLEAIADEIDALGETLTERAMQESGLPHARLTGERGRTSGQLRLFARELRLGEYLRARIDHAIPDRQPAPKPDLRLRMIPLGPVVVFGASNFPLAFSVAGGDTASALAAGCPVIVKGHSAHPGTSELVAGAIARAVEKTGMPAGTFSLINGAGNEVGAALVSDPRVKAVGFTGSRGGGTALMKIAANRPVPIPVYAEMSSINPVFLLPHALEARAEALGKGYIASLTMGAGQFCTNPGLVLALESPALDRFLAAATEAVSGVAAQTMLTPGILKAYENGVARWAAAPGLTRVAQGQEGSASCGRAALFTMTGADFIADPSHAEEVFGAASLLVRCADLDEMLGVVSLLEGQLTATLHLEDADTETAARLLPILERLAGRILANGWPTGVEVTDAQVHGGPFPSTADGRSTSVGTLAIDRFLRPVAYQDLPAALLPAELRDGDAGVPRRIDGKPTL